MQIVETGFPMERIAMDILCELRVTSGGNKHILVISEGGVHPNRFDFH
jgi:hypothetical protein